MSEFADKYIERLNYVQNQPNTFFFDGDALVLVPKDLENMNKLKEFEAARKEGIKRDLREQIAKEIEDLTVLTIGIKNYDIQILATITQCKKASAAIARATK